MKLWRRGAHFGSAFSLGRYRPAIACRVRILGRLRGTGSGDIAPKRPTNMAEVRSHRGRGGPPPPPPTDTETGGYSLNMNGADLRTFLSDFVVNVSQIEFSAGSSL